MPRIGIFGTGWTARMVVPAFRESGFDVTAICGKKLETAEIVANDLGIPFRTNSFIEFLLKSEVDAVCIVAPPHTHAEMAVKALSAGKHVFCQFPMALTLADADKMVTSARYYPRLLSLCHNPLRYIPAVIRMKEMIAEGFCGALMVGEVVVRRGPLVHPKGYTWMCDKTMGGGLLNSVGSYIVDVLAFLTNQRVSEVNGSVRTMVSHAPGVEGFRAITSDDFCSFLLRCDSGLNVTVTLNAHLPHHYSQELMLIGERGRLSIRGCELYGQSKGETRERLLVRGDDMTGKTQAEVDGLVSVPSLFVNGTERAINVLRSGFESSQIRMQVDAAEVADSATFEDGMYVHAVLDAINDSSSTGCWQDVTISTEVGEQNPFWTSSIGIVGNEPDRASPMPMRPAVS